MTDNHYGLDFTLIEANLRLTPEERAIQHFEALKLRLALEEQGRARRSSE